MFLVLNLVVSVIPLFPLPVTGKKRARSSANSWSFTCSALRRSTTLYTLFRFCLTLLEVKGRTLELRTPVSLTSPRRLLQLGFISLLLVLCIVYLLSICKTLCENVLRICLVQKFKQVKCWTKNCQDSLLWCTDQST